MHVFSRDIVKSHGDFKYIHPGGAEDEIYWIGSRMLAFSKDFGRSKIEHEKKTEKVKSTNKITI